MKKLVLPALALGMCLQLPAQDKLELLIKNTSPVQSVCIQDTSYDDLEALGKAIGESRIVMLGEMESGDGETLRAKARIVRYLHQKHGFSVLAMPSEFYATNMLWDKHHNSDSALMPLNELWTRTSEFSDIREYISQYSTGATPLMVTGYGAETTFEPSISQFINNAHSLFTALGYKTRDISYQHYLSTLLKANDINALRNMDDTTFSYLKHTTMRILADIEQKPGADRTGFYAQSLRNLLGYVYYCWQNRGASNETAFDATIRHKQMASNILWLADKKYASRKIIIWGNNQAISKNNDGLEIMLAGYRKTQPTTMGNELAQIFEDELFSIGFTSLEGITNPSSDEPVDIRETGRNDWYTNQLELSGYHYAFTNFRNISVHEELDANFVMRGWSYQYEMKGNWFRVFDGMFFIKTNNTAAPRVQYAYQQQHAGGSVAGR